MTYQERWDRVFQGPDADMLTKQIAIAVADVAFEIGIEEGTTARNVARRQYATRVTNNLATMLDDFKRAVAATADGVADPDIKTAVQNAWDVMSAAIDAS